MDNVLAEALVAVHDSRWKPSYLRKRRESIIQWLPLTHLAGKSYPEGVTHDGRWVVETADGLLEIEGSQLPAIVLPLLERPPDEVMVDLQVAFTTNGLSADFASSFPINSVIACGLSSSSHWAELAMNWIEHLHRDNRIPETVIYLLETLVHNKERQPQRTRHRARRILNLLVGP